MKKRFRVNDQDYDYDPDALFDLSFAEARSIKANTGLTIADWQYGLTTFYRGDPDLVAALIWVVCRRAERPVTWAEIDVLSTVNFLGSVSNVEEPESEDEAPEGSPEGTSNPEPCDPPASQRNGKTPAKRKRPEKAATS